MTGEQSPYSGREVTEYLDDDYKLHDRDGDEIGKIVEINEDFLVVERGGGFLGLGESEHIFVPRDAIQRDEGANWYLGIGKDDVDSRGWNERPSRRSADTGRTDKGRTDKTGTREGTRLVRYEEDVEAQKTARQKDEVTVGKHVVEDTKTVEVPVRREEVHVERHPVTADATTGVSGDEAFQDERITVPVMEEEVEVHKVARPVEEIEITKSSREDTERVEDTVRREEFDVDDRTSGASRERGDEHLR